MWTYKRPYNTEEITKDYIEKRGRLALSRALSVGRVIGFVASGATIGYGQTSWKDLVKTATDEALGRGKSGAGAPPAGRRNGAARTAEIRLEQLSADDRLTDDEMHSLGLAERLAFETGNSVAFRKAIARVYAKTRGHHGYSEDLSGGLKRRAQPLRRLVADLRLTRLLTLNYDCEIEEEFHRLYRTSGAKTAAAVYGSGTAQSDFEVLCAGEFDKALGLPPRVEYSDGTSRSVLSLSMNSQNIGELVNFALQPLQFRGQVVHLHGRFDQPQDMVLTDADYRRTYLKSDEQAQTFEEALSALMSGNDILFVGVGMQEADLLRPLRQFVSRDKTPEFSKRHVFVMREHTVSLDEAWLHRADVSGTEEADFAAQHIAPWTTAKERRRGGACDDFGADEKTAVMSRSEYGLYSIFHGDKSHRAILLACKLLLAIQKSGDESPLKRKYNPQRYLAALAAMKTAITGLCSAAPDCIDQGLPAELCSKAELEKLLTGLTDAHEQLAALIAAADQAKAAANKKSRDKNLFLAQLACEAEVHDFSFADLPDTDLEEYLRDLASEVRSRALDVALAGFSVAKDKWWDEWRKAPKSRDAEFRRRYVGSDKDAQSRPSTARHRPIYAPVRAGLFADPPKIIARLRELAREEHQLSAQTHAAARATISGGHLAGRDTNQLSYFSAGPKNAAQRDFAKVPPKRIVRATVPRGHGKGALLHLLQQPLVEGGPVQPKLFVDTIFPTEGAGALQDGRYFGTFCLHLSFSMEFASVISALKIFAEQAACGVFVEYPDLVLQRARRRLNDGVEGTFLQFLCSEINDLGKTELIDLIDGCRDLPGDQKKAKIKDFRAYFDEHFWGSQNLLQGAGRMHRLEELRTRLSAFTDMVDLLMDHNLRLAIVMSGMDKLCDSQGLAHNPMFRALFRLLSGCGAKYESESDITTPIDLFMINGTKDAPPRYLSKEYSRGQLKRVLGRPEDVPPADHYASYGDYRGLPDDRFLATWPVLPAIDFSERFWLQDCASQNLQRLLVEDVASLGVDFDLGEGLERREIERMCRTGVALHSWISGAHKVQDARMAASGRSDKERKTMSVCFVNQMNAAAERGEIAQILREILEIHKHELRNWGALIRQDAEECPTSEINNWPDKQLRQQTAVWRNDREVDANQFVDLAYLVLSHLSLFPMPVETRILYGCDQIYGLLKQITRPALRKLGGAENKRDIARLVRLRLLSQVLEYLHQSSLIIAVSGKSISGGGWPLDVGCIERKDEDIHTRYTVQHQLRDFTARLMDLSLPDHGERNFFQVSVYCDQPRDLPAPREDHYALVRQIMDRQIDQTKHTIWTMMQVAKARKGQGRLSKEDQELFDSGLRRRTVKLSHGSHELDPQLPSLHAVPQRIRALYGLLRSGFSIGTVSRLSALDDREIDQPYERFRGWLRGVTNAATGWDHVLDTYFHADDPNHAEVDLSRSKRSLDDVAKLVHEHAEQHSKPNTDNCLKAFNGFARPLYRDEIGWLLNERGLVSLVQGQIFDAIPLFQRALDEMHHDDLTGSYDPSLHAAVRRVRLNMAIALIDRGHLNRAKTMLRSLQLPEDLSRHSGSQVSWMAEGYIGLVHHLSGNLVPALASYDLVIERAQDLEMMRVVGIFAKHRADLLRRLSKFDEARAAIVMSTNAALHCAQRDILHLSKISEGNLDLVDPKGSAANAGICMIEAVQFAQTMGIPRLESEARCLQAAMMLAQSERMLAGSFASEAAAIANRNGLRLNKLLALKHYGAALRQRGQMELSLQVLTETRRESERRGYQGLAKGLAEELRHFQ